MTTVLQTDFAWPDDSIERAVIEQAGFQLVTGPSTPLPSAEIEHLVRQHDPRAIMTCWADISTAAIAAPSDLRIVHRIGVGLDNIAVDAATARGAWVTNVPDYCVAEVSDHAVGLLLDWARGISRFDTDVKAGRWRPAAARLRRVADLIVGIVGFGRIGQATATKLRAFGCDILVHSRRPVDGEHNVELQELLSRCDVVILHAPLTAETHHLIDAAALTSMRDGALLINVSRGGLVDTNALIAALEHGRPGAAALDVIEGEPDPPRALVERSDVVVTPHVAFSSDASLAELRRRSAEEVVRVLRGEPPLHPCNRPEATS